MRHRTHHAQIFSQWSLDLDVVDILREAADDHDVVLQPKSAESSIQYSMFISSNVDKDAFLRQAQLLLKPVGRRDIFVLDCFVGERISRVSAKLRKIIQGILSQSRCEDVEWDHWWRHVDDYKEARTEYEEPGDEMRYAEEALGEVVQTLAFEKYMDGNPGEYYHAFLHKAALEQALGILDQYKVFLRTATFDQLQDFMLSNALETLKGNVREKIDSCLLDKMLLCGARSVRSGKHCTLEEGHLGKHDTGIGAVFACGCGRSRSYRRDPFSLEEANVEFFDLFQCCLSLNLLPHGCGWKYEL